MTRQAWAGWCPECFTGPITLDEHKRVPAHRHDGKDCAGAGMLAHTWERARCAMEASFYDRR